METVRSELALASTDRATRRRDESVDLPVRSIALMSFARQTQGVTDRLQGELEATRDDLEAARCKVQDGESAELAKVRLELASARSSLEATTRFDRSVGSTRTTSAPITTPR